jgi:8-hydroxy-5-deazaflavin:NADPH oxidoreductase
MTYAIIGAGAIGTALARQFARKSIQVKIANSRGPASMASVVGELGGNIEPVELAEALAADVVILAVPFTAAAETVQSGGLWNGRIVVDATNAINFTDFSPADLGGRPSSEIVAEAASGARLVKAFNTLPASVLADVPDGPNGRRAIFVSSNDATASKTVEKLADSLGFAPIALGKLAEGGRLQQFGGALMVHSLIKQG